MKRLFLLRHAKAIPDVGLIPDIERRLSDSGKKEAEEIARQLKSTQILPSHIVSSPAKRTIETSEIFLRTLESPIFSIEKSLYHGGIDDVLSVCFGLSDDVEAPMIVFHNPGITHFANTICDASIYNVPTCGLLIMDVDIKHWNKIDPTTIHFKECIFPTDE